MTWKEVSVAHHHLLARMKKSAVFPRYAGVRVFQEGDKGGRPHAHWVCTPKLPFAELQRLMSETGWGHLYIHPVPCSIFLSYYLARYLRRGALPGVRRWACFGEFKGVKKVDVEITSKEADAWRADFAAAKERGFSKREAFVDATVRANLRKYGMLADFMKRYDHTRTISDLRAAVAASQGEPETTEGFLGECDR